jgi:hypothetical protein
VRIALTVTAVLLLLVAAGAPHAHGGDPGAHACLACVVAAGEPFEAATLAPQPLPPVSVLDDVAPESPVTGAPLGAVPGQSPPVRS